MSRFVLRSKEGTKLSDQKDKIKSPSNALRTPPKRVDSRKSRNSVNPKDLLQPVSCPSKQKNADGEEEGKNAQISIICSLPLSRLTGIIEKLSIKTPTKCNSGVDIDVVDTVFTKPGPTANGANFNDEDDSKEKEEERQSGADDDNSNSKSHDQLLVKILCLYCDKKFSTHKMQLKHIEKFHTPLRDRRCSVRNSQVQTSPRNKSGGRPHDRVSAALGSTNFPGCTYCKKTKSPETADSAIDFNGLFLHLTEYHADKYFGCKICVMRFQNIAKLLNHMQNVHNTLPDAQLKLTKEYNDTLDESNIEPTSPIERHTRTKQRHTGKHESTSEAMSVRNQTSVMGAEEAILSRLGLTQNRRRNPSNRKGVRLRRDTSVSDMLLKTDTTTPGTSAASLNASPSKSRSRATAKCTNAIGDSDSVIFRVPARTDTLSTTFDESFYKEVTSNVRNNLLYHLDGKLDERSHNSVQEPTEDKSLPLLLRGTLACNITIQECLESNQQDSEIHVATNLPATTAFPTLLTAEQYCVDVTTAKIRRPHTKNSWKWKWDSVKKYKLINEGGKIVKKAKHPMLGLRDLSKLDMWTQLSMRQKHEKQLGLMQDAANVDECSTGEKRRLNDQLNSILDMRVLPHIILEQSEQAIIKLENDEFNFTTTFERQDEGDDFYAGNIVGQTFADEGFPSLLQLLPRREARQPERKLVLSGEWARPRCYLCMCCGNKFEKLKSLEEHKMFRHSNILSTHYEVVGRELLAGNILQHLFIPKRALTNYNTAVTNSAMASNKSLVSYRRVNTSAEEESSDSIQSITNCYATQRTFSLKHTNSTTDDCDTDTKTTLLGDMNTVSPSLSLQSSFSSSLTPTSSLSQNLQKEKSSERKWKCSKCSRKCNSMSDLYRHMLDCSGDYVWSMAKKRKYRYYCGSKKRRPLHKQHMLESRKTKQEKATKTQSLENCTTEESSSNSYKPKTPPKPRPSDAESIKKMLENLPPKRICKKIFPTVNKTKKTRKPTFITKLYNTKVLRKTRARQISNAVKRAANTRFSGKSQIKNNALKTLRSKANKKIEHAKKLNQLADAANVGAKTIQPEKRSSPKKDLILEDEKQESKKAENSEAAATEEKDSKSLEKSLEEEPKSLSSECTNKQSNLEPPVAQEQVENVVETNSIRNVNSDAKTKTSVQAAVESTQSVPKTQQAESQACNKKRSKRISDCIAMLTGKLEEKLKTELIVNSKHDETVDMESKTTSPEKQKKLPKRKAVSRRIIKPDVNDTTSSEFEQPTKTVIPTTVPPIVTTTVTTSKRATIAKEPTTSGALTPKVTPVASSALTTTLTTQKAKPPSLPTPLPNVAIPIQTPTIVGMPMTVQPPNAQTKLVLPGAITQSALVSIPISIASTLHAVPVPLKVLQNQLPVYLPVQQSITPAKLPPRTPLPLTIPPNVNAAPGLMPTVALLPPPPLLQAHVSPVLAPATSPLCNMEPLNLSSAKGPKKQSTAELRAQRPGMPARRQTICGFEARDLLSYNDMEPLDLSKKSREHPVAVPPPPPAQVTHLTAQATMPPMDLLSTIQPAHTLPQLPLPPATRIQIDEATTKTSNMIIPPTLPTEAVFNKQFYSNLDLLKIPQIRSAGYMPANLPANETTVNAANTAINLNICTNANVPITLKTTNKKRNNSKSAAEQITNKLPPAAAVMPTNKVKDNTSSNKKESAGKNKPITKMDEEVINHIDDAINSVINAVKASLPENDEVELLPAKLVAKPFEININPKEKTPESIEKLSVEPILNKENSTPAVAQIVLTPKKRTLRSKTLDCRSELMRITEPPSPILRNSYIQPTVDIKGNEIPPIIEPIPTLIAIDKKLEESTKQPIAKEVSTIVVDKAPVPAIIENNKSEKALAAAASTHTEKETVCPLNKSTENKLSIEPTLQESNVNLSTEENMSNINNTSSGFHSSGTPENGTDVKKKQRRRRKNELAAIVADQLLESFKIDKARRDSLKKLENLAYEKSEDLLLTGMLLMSSTKRNATSGMSFSQNITEKRVDSSTRRQKQETSTPKTRGKSNENATKNILPKAQPAAKEELNEITTRKSKRRQSRRKATPLDNENLSKLKSSLESFSIGIEKQLSELEARNTNIFNNTDKQARKGQEQAPLKPTSSILRPSILSATLEQVDTQWKNSVTDNNKAATFSRDPRLNKNIHKDEQQTTLLPTDINVPPVCDLEDDNYLTEIAKNVNEKIMSAENEDFAFADDGFEIGNEYQDDSNSKFSRPPTSMSVRSAPNFNDDRSNFGSICDENTNTEVMDMDLDDELSVYTSFSQDLGRGRGRKRRRRRSILLKRRPKKRRASQDLTAEKFECELCKKTFFAATSLAKHNMTLAHVSKVSEREYLLSKSSKATALEDQSNIGPKPSAPQNTTEDVVTAQYENLRPIIPVESVKEPINIVNADTSSHRLSLNPDERLFFECCNILKSADTSRAVRGDNDNDNQNSFVYQNVHKNQTAAAVTVGRVANSINERNLNLLQKPMFEEKSDPKTGHAAKTQDAFRNPIAIPNSFTKLSSTVAAIPNERQIHSPTYTQFSAVTNTTSRFKTKAAMKGYENGNVHVTVPDESKSRATCKLTELADIALGHDDKPRTPEMAPNLDQAVIGTAKRIVTPEYVTLSVVDSRRNCNYNAVQDNKKNTETQGSSSSRTIMHSSIIKAAVEEHSKPQSASRIVIPERPFKNIGLEEKESITFQKPKTTVNLLLDDNSVSTASYSDRDDFDFGSLSCDDEVSDKTLNEKNLKSNSSDSSSSRATAKTFENKSLIMGRIFKNASTKPKAPVKSVGVQKDHTPKADLDQLFDELRAEGVPKSKTVDAPVRKDIVSTTQAHENVCQDNVKVAAPVVANPEPKRKTKAVPKKPKAAKKPQKDFTKLQSELGMSQEEIEKLIDDGQRKSKRRCATNRSKKMVEMWSSDEYEEFLSTKDIIALIEEKEKQEQRKKRKSSVVATNIEVDKEKVAPTATVTVMNEIAVTSTRKAARSQLNTVQKVEEKQKNAAATALAKPSIKGKTPSNSANDAASRKTNTWIKPPEESTNTSKALKSKRIKNTRQTSNKGHKDIKVAEKTVAAKTEAPPETLALAPQVSEQNLYLLDLKQNQNNNNNNTSRNNKTKKDKSAKEDKSAKQDVNSFKSRNRETYAEIADLKKRNNNNNKKAKGKRKPQTEKSPTRKRQASEKLYYWSSSSDEDFGRINDNEPEFESSEQYQKHGWIVGDSHKKLVTLLAIAKGNKKVESGGVKKKVSKKKS